jgi:riboflavin synthase
MFTGIIEELGSIAGVEKNRDGARIRVAASVVTSDASEGDSIAVNGVCLTALDIRKESFAADVSGETLRRSTLGSLGTGSRVNLERAVTPSTRLGGHIVQGHVDATGTFLGADREGDFWTVKIGYPKEIGRYLVFKGSVSVEGISLTIASLYDEHFEIAVIPKTWQLTNFSSLKEGAAVNLEADVIAKYVERILNYGSGSESKDDPITMAQVESLLGD